VAYNDTLALALRYAPQIGTPSTTTKPTLAAANEIWADAYNEVRLAFRHARLADDSLTGLALQLAKQAEAYCTSGNCLLSKASIGKDAKATSDDLLARCAAILKSLNDRREELIAEGSGEEATRANPFVKSRQVDDADPNFDFTAGTGDRPYADNAIWPQDGSEL